MRGASNSKKLGANSASSLAESCFSQLTGLGLQRAEIPRPHHAEHMWVHVLEIDDLRKQAKGEATGNLWCSEHWHPQDTSN